MDLYAHVRIIVGVVISLGLTHLLRSAAHMIQHPGKQKIYWVHMMWALFMFIYVLHYWWWEFWLRELRYWSFAIYLFTIAYAVLIYMTCAMLFPDSMADYPSYEEYFYSRRQWFFGLLIALFALDLVDTLLKGRQYYLHLGMAYALRAIVFIAGCAIAIATRNRRYHQFFSIIGVVYQLLYIFSLYSHEFSFACRAEFSPARLQHRSEATGHANLDDRIATPSSVRVRVILVAIASGSACRRHAIAS